MPELPEVTTTVNGLQRVLPKLAITDVWTDLSKEKTLKQFENTIKNKSFYKKFRTTIMGKKVINVERRAKNILINIEGGQTILIHLKMTGHIIYGKYVFNKKENKWTPNKNERASLHDPYNRFVHVVFSLSNGYQFVFCDSRKFGKVTLLQTDKAHETVHLKNIGPEPLAKNFTFENFKERIYKKPNGNIKTVLMDQSIIAGIGNIYSDEMLWMSSIHPESKPKNIPSSNMKLLYESMKQVLNKGIDFGGDSMSDYRDINGERGKFQNHHNVYQKKNEKCGKRLCTGVIIRKVINGRSSHFCNKHQKLYVK
jgi:formamidopyrimidine-DNA glycosylase